MAPKSIPPINNKPTFTELLERAEALPKTRLVPNDSELWTDVTYGTFPRAYRVRYDKFGDAIEIQRSGSWEIFRSTDKPA